MRHPLFIALLLACGSVVAAPRAELLPATPGDLVPSHLVAAKSAGITDIERAPVAFAWAMDPATVVEAPRPYVAESREFWTLVDAADLKAGFRIDTSAPGALIRFSPADAGKSATLGIEGLSLRAGGKQIGGGAAFALAVDEEQLKAAGADFGAGTLALRIHERLGSGRFELVAEKAAGRYLVHVFEPGSDIAMTLAADQGSLLAGDTLTVSARFAKGGDALALDGIGGVLTSPAGENFPLDFKRAADGSHQASLRVPESALGGVGLWEVHGFASAKQGDLDIQRDARTAVGIGHATAKLAGGYTLDSSDGLAFSLPVEVASPGRYELRATLFATGKDGRLAPVAQSHSAAWLDASGSITLGFEKTLVPADYGAPFELRDLMLKDQGRMADLERRATALRLDRLPSHVERTSAK